MKQVFPEWIFLVSENIFCFKASPEKHTKISYRFLTVSRFYVSWSSKEPKVHIKEPAETLNFICLDCDQWVFNLQFWLFGRGNQRSGGQLRNEVLPWFSSLSKKSDEGEIQWVRNQMREKSRSQAIFNLWAD